MYFVSGLAEKTALESFWGAGGNIATYLPQLKNRLEAIYAEEKFDNLGKVRLSLSSAGEFFAGWTDYQKAQFARNAGWF